MSLREGIWFEQDSEVTSSQPRLNNIKTEQSNCRAGLNVEFCQMKEMAGHTSGSEASAIPFETLGKEASLLVQIDGVRGCRQDEKQLTDCCR